MAMHELGDREFLTLVIAAQTGESHACVTAGETILFTCCPLVFFGSNLEDGFLNTSSTS
jgi:putative Ca2+/H+ antiporter (TMEM165/GDT1 family)